MSEVIVHGEDVWKVYGKGETEVRALHGVTLDVRRGEMLAVMGPSGSGKTTLLNCFSGLDGITRGRVTIEGTDIHRMSDKEQSAHRARRTGFVFQAYNLLPVLTAQENVEIPLLVSGVAPAQAKARAREILGQLGLGERLGHRPSELSGGQQQRVSLARALATRPAIVWADEPTGNLDQESSTQVVDLLRQLNREHQQTLVVVTHSPEVASICDRTLTMRNGRMVG